MNAVDFDTSLPVDSGSVYLIGPSWKYEFDHSINAETIRRFLDAESDDFLSNLVDVELKNSVIMRDKFNYLEKNGWTPSLSCVSSLILIWI
jgi:hypothetical protein